MSLAALIGIDRERYDAGNKFLSQDPYLQNFQARAPITFNVSPNMNTGIMSPLIYPYPIIPQGGGGDDNNIFGGIDKGEITSDVGFGNLNDETGMGYTLTDEDKEAIASQKNKDRLAQAAQLGLFALNPVGYLMGTGVNKAFGFVKDKFFGGGGDGGGFDQDAYDAGKASAIAQEVANRDYARSGGDDSGSSGGGGNMSASDFSDDSPGTPFQYGGIVGLYR